MSSKHLLSLKIHISKIGLLFYVSHGIIILPVSQKNLFFFKKDHSRALKWIDIIDRTNMIKTNNELFSDDRLIKIILKSLCV